ncbi:hypothetical protein CVS40_3024 [Lucilia cuprina]|nr:hypothetical protein CVS40_3024 [Lucilia cuprina]
MDKSPQQPTTTAAGTFTFSTDPYSNKDHLLLILCPHSPNRPVTPKRPKKILLRFRTHRITQVTLVHTSLGSPYKVPYNAITTAIKYHPRQLLRHSSSLSAIFLWTLEFWLQLISASTQCNQHQQTSMLTIISLTKANFGTTTLTATAQQYLISNALKQ